MASLPSTVHPNATALPSGKEDRQIAVIREPGNLAPIDVQLPQHGGVGTLGIHPLEDGLFASKRQNRMRIYPPGSPGEPTARPVEPDQLSLM